MKCLIIVDSLKYIKTDCFQSQLYSALQRGYDIKIVELQPLQIFKLKKSFVNIEKFDKVISLLRLRTLYGQVNRIADWLEGCPITIYDQDPWESYMDSSPYKGAYIMFREKLNVQQVCTTSVWWANRVSQDGLPAKFVRMGMNPEWCDHGPEFFERPLTLGYRGTLKDHRKIIFDKLRALDVGLEVSEERLSYVEYMAYLNQLKFFTHDESELPFVCDGELVPRSTGIWIKSIEVVSRGAFCLRDYHPEGETYNISDLPLIRCYESCEEIPDIINDIQKSSSTKLREMQIETVRKIRKQYDWFEVAHTLITGEA